MASPCVTRCDARVVVGFFYPCTSMREGELLHSSVQFWFDLPGGGTVAVQFQFRSKGFAKTSCVYMGQDF